MYRPTVGWIFPCSHTTSESILFLVMAGEMNVRFSLIGSRWFDPEGLPSLLFTFVLLPPC